MSFINGKFVNFTSLTANRAVIANGSGKLITSNGTTTQYLRGDGSIADFPANAGGGSVGVVYYLNGGTSQGTIGGTTYYQMSSVAVTGSAVDFTLNGDGLICSFLTNVGVPNVALIPAGNFNFEIYASLTNNVSGTPQIYIELYKYDGTNFTLISTTQAAQLQTTNIDLYTFPVAVPATVMNASDRLAIKIYSANIGSRTVAIHTQDSHLCEVITTFTTGITSLNGLTLSAQTMVVGTSGTNFTISSSGSTHTFNIPVSSATNTGLLSSSNWTTFNNKLSKGTKTIFCIDNGDFANGQAAIDAASAGDTILFGAKSGGWGDLVIPVYKKLSLTGLQSERSLYVQVGSITYSPTTGTQIVENELYIESLYITSSTSDCITHGGTSPSRIRINNCFINPTGASNKGMVFSNTNANSSSYAYQNVLISTNTATLIQSSVAFAKLYRNTVDCAAIGLTLTAGTLENNLTNYSSSTTGNCISITGGTMLCGYSLVSTTGANSSGVAVSTGAVFASSYNTFSVPTGTGYCVRGTGIHVYSSMTFANSALLAYNVKVQNTLTNVPYTTAFTLSP